MALLFTQQELQAGMARVEAFFGQQGTGVFSVVLGLLVLALITLAVRWFLSVAVTLRVLDGVIFSVQALRVEQGPDSPEPEVGYRLSRGILVPSAPTRRLRGRSQVRRL